MAAAAAALLALSTGPSLALSEIQRETVAPPAATAPQAPADTEETLPMPDAGQPADEPGDVIGPDEEPDEPDDAVTPDGPSRPHVDDGPPPPVLYDIGALPEPVQRMRNLILEATQKGDIEGLRPLIGSGDSQTQLSLGGLDGDPIQFLKDLSGDDQGHEILAIMEEVLSAGYVHLDVGTPNELYIWPYFFALPIDNLTPRQRVELFKIVTAGDYEDMKSFGAYIFYRIGITPDGHWSFFVAGD
jgi:hypothetical protein